VPFKSSLQKLFASNNNTGWLLSVLFSLLLCTTTARAWDEKFYNPHPENDDIVLPMPCEGSMVFRKIPVPVSKPMDDYPINIGGADADWDFVENTHPEFIAGSFADKQGNSFFLLGKYEISNLQYSAVMEKDCPKPSMKGRLPQARVNWFESIDFTNRYNLWLLQNAKAKIPSKDGKPGFVRLPTEIEWEYAARGGVAVSPSVFQERLFPITEDVKQYVWLAGTQSAKGKAQLTGLLQPNPLALYDILGNVDEIVLNPFRLNKLTREHGVIGSFVVRGGNFMTSEAAMRTALREEVPYYIKTGLRKSKTTGFRLALGSSLLTSLDTIKEYQQAWRQLGKDIVQADVKPGMNENALDNPVDELAAIAEAATDENMQKRLKDLLLVFRGSIEAQTEQTNRAAKSALRLGTFLCRNLSEDASILRPVQERYQQKCPPQEANSNYCKKRLNIIKAKEAAIEKNLIYYADTITQVAVDYSTNTLNGQKDVIVRILKGRKLDAIIPYLESYRSHLDGFAANGRIMKKIWLQECIAINAT
jgi:Sulfatase-modifying factor enzyme 1